MTVANLACRTSSGITESAGSTGRRRVSLSVSSVLYMSAPKNGCAHANDGGAFLNRDVEIAAHPHRQLVKQMRWDPAGHPPVAQLTQLTEPGARVLRGIGHRWNDHQTHDAR